MSNQTQTSKGMTTCQACGKEIAKSAKACPSCGAKQNKPIYKKWWFWIIAIVVLIIIIQKVGGTDSPTTDEEKEETPIEYTVIDAKTFTDEFDANQLAAEEKYSGKYVELTAEIKNISGTSNSPYISLEAINAEDFSLTRIQCYVQNKDKISSLVNGQSATIQGKVGNQSFGSIEIKECIVK